MAQSEVEFNQKPHLNKILLFQETYPKDHIDIDYSIKLANKKNKLSKIHLKMTKSPSTLTIKTSQFKILSRQSNQKRRKKLRIKKSSQKKASSHHKTIWHLSVSSRRHRVLWAKWQEKAISLFSTKSSDKSRTRESSSKTSWMSWSRSAHRWQVPCLSSSNNRRWQMSSLSKNSSSNEIRGFEQIETAISKTG